MAAAGTDSTEEAAPVSPLEACAIGLVVLVILCLGALAVMGPEGRLAFLIYDDAYYYLGVAGHLAAGEGSTFDGLHPTNGYHPGWALLLVPVMAVAGSPGVALRLAAALWFVLAAAAPRRWTMVCPRLWPSRASRPTHSIPELRSGSPCR